MAEESTERFVDQAEKAIPAQDTWDQLTASQLIDVKLQLENKLWHFNNVPQMAAVLKRSIDTITKLIASSSVG